MHLNRCHDPKPVSVLPTALGVDAGFSPSAVPLNSLYMRTGDSNKWRAMARQGWRKRHP